MRYHHEFEWDPAKAKTNEQKHGVGFRDAAIVLRDDQADVFHPEQSDDAHSMKEVRWITPASHPSDRGIILWICWTDRSTEDKRITRIISARGVSRRERMKYERYISKEK